MGLCLSLLAVGTGAELAGYGPEMSRATRSAIESVDQTLQTGLAGFRAIGDRVIDVFLDPERCMNALSGHQSPNR